MEIYYSNKIFQISYHIKSCQLREHNFNIYNTLYILNYKSMTFYSKKLEKNSRQWARKQSKQLIRGPDEAKQQNKNSLFL